MSRAGALDRLRPSGSRRTALGRQRARLAAAGRAVRRDRAATLALGVVAAFVLLAVFAPALAPYPPGESVLTDGEASHLEPPSARHPFGTTHLSEDVFSQWVFGSRVSLLVGFASALSVVLVGVPVGIVAGYYRGTVDLLLMRAVDVLYGVPPTPLILVLALFLGASLWNVVLAMVLVLWRTMARLVRARTLTIAKRPYVKAARAAGASDLRIMALHVLPNLLPLVVIEMVIVAGLAIILEAGLSFLGFGTQEMVSWGSMLQSTLSTGAIRTAWWWFLPPGLSITALVVALFFLARAVETVTSPGLDRREL